MLELLKNKTALLAAIASAALGFIVLLGWYLNLPALIQVLPQFAPMQYNTALGFLLSGIGFLSVVYYDRIKTKEQKNSTINRLSLLTGLAVVLLGSVTILQYIFNVNLALDQIFMDAYITVKTSHPGRMAPNTALCFILTGSAISLLSLNKNITFIEIIALLILSFSVMALVGYLVGEENGYAWGKLTGMALHTTVGFITLGVGIVGFVWSARTYSIASVPMWFPSLLCFIVLLLDMLSLKWSSNSVQRNRFFI